MKHKGTIAGLRTVQTLGSLAVPVSLENVPEEVENKQDEQNSKTEIFRTDDWKRVEKAVRSILRQEFFPAESGAMYDLQKSVRNIRRSKTGTFLCDLYKEWLNKETSKFSEKLRDLEGTRLLLALEQTWTAFYGSMLSLLEAALHQLKPKGRLSVRSIALAVFRDVVFLSNDKIEEHVKSAKDTLSPPLRQMVLILYSVSDVHPPSKNMLKLESVASQVCTPFMGYFGLYENGRLVVVSNEPKVTYKRRPSSDVGARRISRPFRLQPQQMDTLHQMFKKAIRHKS